MFAKKQNRNRFIFQQDPMRSRLPRLICRGASARLPQISAWFCFPLAGSTRLAFGRLADCTAPRRPPPPPPLKLITWDRLPAARLRRRRDSLENRRHTPQVFLGSRTDDVPARSRRWRSDCSSDQKKKKNARWEYAGETLASPAPARLILGSEETVHASLP